MHIVPAQPARQTTTPVDAPARDRWFFIVGCQRSGTTLMRLVLECHSAVTCWDESVAYPVIGGKRPPPASERPLVGLKVPCLTEQLLDDYVWEAKLLPRTRNVYDGQRIVFMVRDVRDTIASMMGLRLSGRTWLETHLMPAFRAKLHRDAAFGERYADVLSAIGAARHPRLARAALYWRYKVEALEHYLQRGLPVLVVRYEDVARQPGIELLRVCGFLQIPWEPSLLDHHAQPHTQLDDRGMATGETDPHRAIDGESVGQWTRVLSDDQAAEILTFAGPMQTLLYGREDAGVHRDDHRV